MNLTPFHLAIRTSRIEWVNTGFLALNRLMLIALLTAVFCTDAAADADGPDYWRIVGVADGDSLNIRAQPNGHSAKLGTISANGRCIANRGCQGGLSFEEYSTLSKPEQAKRLKEHPRWCRIVYQGLTGWVAGRYLAEDGCP
jgi:hypothetical protein